MKDIDFDELDRAVNSAISKKQSDMNLPQQPSSIPEPSTTAEQTNIPTAIQPVASQIAPKPLPTVPVRPVRPAVERPSTGRFLDMVRSSATTKTSTTTSANTSTPTGFSTIQLQNRQMLNGPMRSSTGIAMNQAVNTPKPLVPTTQKPTTDAVTKTSSVSDGVNSLNIDKISGEFDKNLGINLNNPQDSPFLSDAKVEKRPLNASMSDDDEVLSQMQINQPRIEDSQMKNTNTPLPAELGIDLLSIEANEVMKTLPDVEMENDDVQINKIVEIPENDLIIEKPLTHEVEPKPNTEILEQKTNQNQIVVNSIPQQYQEKPNSNQQDSGAIYDVNNYHKAASPAKKKSGWSWVVWTIVLMVVSVGAGVAVYFFVLPQI